MNYLSITFTYERTLAASFAFISSMRFFTKGNRISIGHWALKNNVVTDELLSTGFVLDYG